MTEQEFKVSLTKEQLEFYYARIKEAFELEEKYYREAQAARVEIMLILHALNLEPIQSLPALSDAVRKTVKRIQEEAPIKRREKTRLQPGRAESGEAIMSAKIADFGPTAEKLGDPRDSGNKIQQYLSCKDRPFEETDSNAEERQEP